MSGGPAPERGIRLSDTALPVGAAALFGLCLTSYVLFIPGHPYVMQVISSTIKLPLIMAVSSVASVAALSMARALRLVALDGAMIRRAAADCFRRACLVLGGCAPVLFVIGTRGNYSVTLASAYAAFMLAGLCGVYAFGRRLDRDTQLSAGRRKTATLVWCVLFGLISAETGWSLRPLVGWTGQPFQWVRTDQTRIWNQIVCETRNLRMGGIRFPSAGEASADGSWPC